ncbi:MAG: DUF1330 domain-containing protein [Candidatus Krumholzibacteria bacterium]
MAAYIIGEVEITDPEKYQEYIKVVPETIAAYGGTFRVRGGKAENLEGAWDPKRVIVLEFESMERAKEWWASDEYKNPKAMRQAASTARMIIVDGV